MDIKIKRKLAKERSLVLKLTSKQIIEILNGCGYIINYALYDDLGEHIPAISKYYDKEKDEYVIEIKCKLKESPEDKLVHNAFAKISPFTIPTYSNIYNSSIVLLKDYSFNEISMNLDSDQSLEHNNFYAKYMYNLFGEYYRKKYNQQIKKEQKHEKEK